MERPDLSEAKARTRSSNWDTAMGPIVDQCEKEEEDQTPESNTPARIKKRSSTTDLWTSAKVAKLNISSDHQDSSDESDPEVQEEEGKHEEAIQSGLLTEKARGHTQRT